MGSNETLIMYFSTGDVISIEKDYKCVEIVIDGGESTTSFHMAKCESPLKKLRVTATHKLEFSFDGQEKARRFRCINNKDGTVSFQSVIAKKMLALTEDGFSLMTSVDEGDEYGEECEHINSIKFSVKVLVRGANFVVMDDFTHHKHRSVTWSREAGMESLEGQRPRLESNEWKDALCMSIFYKKGFLHLPCVVNSNHIDACIQLINHHLGKPLDAGGTQQGMGKLPGGLSNHKTIQALLTDPNLLTILEAFFHKDGLVLDNQSAQIALRFPEMTGGRFRGTNKSINEKTSSNTSAASSTPITLASHPWHTDGSRQGRLHPFSLLVGVALSDHTAPLSGNLLVWPQTHRAVHTSVVDSGAIDMPAFASALEAEFGVGKRELGEPFSVPCRKGDVVVLHPDLVHEGGPNISSDIRYMVYFRIKNGRWNSNASSWAELTQEYRQDMYVDLPGVIDKHELKNEYEDK